MHLGYQSVWVGGKRHSTTAPMGSTTARTSATRRRTFNDRAIAPPPHSYRFPEVLPRSPTLRVGWLAADPTRRVGLRGAAGQHHRERVSEPAARLIAHRRDVQ